MRQTPETRLVGRLFDTDTVTIPLLGDAAADWYDECHEAWSWNSRYWEQRALLVLKDNIELATSHARHAVALEKHPFTLTTLAKVLVSQMDAEPATAHEAFFEIIDLVESATRMERDKARLSVHPFGVLLTAAIKAKKLRLHLDGNREKRLARLVANANTNFGYDEMICNLIGKLG